MPEDSRDVAPKQFECDPLARDFPSAWRDIWFRRYSKTGADGIARYECPVCNRHFDHSVISYLQGDHIWPYSLCGETSWANYRLICGSCNASKRDFIDLEVRAALGDGSFRQLVISFLFDLISQGKFCNKDRVQKLLGQLPSQKPGPEAFKATD